MFARLKKYASILLVALALAAPPTEAFAYSLLVCDGSGGVASGTLYDTDANGGVCQFQGLANIMSQIVCTFTVILDNVLDQVYCGVQYAMINTLRISLTLYLAVFGAMMLMGTAKLNTREVLTRFLKMAATYMFAMNSAWGIQVVFAFFVIVMSTACQWVVNPLYDFFGTIPIDPPDLSNGDIAPLYGWLDALIYYAIAGPESGNNQKVLGFLIAMGPACPQLSLLGLWFIKTIATALMKTVIMLLMSLAGIAFLVSLTPIFMSLMLWQVTNHFFENWLRYLISFSTQIVLVVAIIVLWIIVTAQFFQFFGELADLIFPYDPTIVVGPEYNPTDTWAICPPVYGFNPDGSPGAWCESGFDAYPGYWDWSGGWPQWVDADNPMWFIDAQFLIPPSKVIDQGQFLYFIFYHITALTVICYAFSVLLGRAHEIANAIAGPGMSSPFQPGFGANKYGSTGGARRPETAGPQTGPRPAPGSPPPRPAPAPGGNPSANLATDISRLVGNR